MTSQLCLLGRVSLVYLIRCVVVGMFGKDRLIWNVFLGVPIQVCMFEHFKLVSLVGCLAVGAPACKYK